MKGWVNLKKPGALRDSRSAGSRTVSQAYRAPSKKLSFPRFLLQPVASVIAANTRAAVDVVRPKIEGIHFKDEQRHRGGLHGTGK